MHCTQELWTTPLCPLQKKVFHWLCLGWRSAGRAQPRYYAAGKHLAFTPFLIPPPALWPRVLDSEQERNHHIVRWYRARVSNFFMEQSQFYSWCFPEAWKISLLTQEGLECNNLPFFFFFISNELISYWLSHVTVYWLYWSWGERKKALRVAIVTHKSIYKYMYKMTRSCTVSEN